MIIEEVLRQRLEGIKNEKGVYITPAFPKLVYVLDEHNCLKGGKYDYITELAVKCSAKRMYPDYISAKKMRENYEGNVFSPMGCRSFLAPWKDAEGNYKFEGRFNQGVVSLNLPQIGILARGSEEKFWSILEERLQLCFEAIMCRHNALKNVRSDSSPIHWQYGAIARLPKGAPIEPLLYGGYSSISLGYIGLYEVTKLMRGCSHTQPEGQTQTQSQESRQGPVFRRDHHRQHVRVPLAGSDLQERSCEDPDHMIQKSGAIVSDPHLLPGANDLDIGNLAHRVLAVLVVGKAGKILGTDQVFHRVPHGFDIQLHRIVITVSPGKYIRLIARAFAPALRRERPVVKGETILCAVSPIGRKTAVLSGFNA